MTKYSRIRVIVGAKINTKVATMDVPEPVIELTHAPVREARRADVALKSPASDDDRSQE